MSGKASSVKKLPNQLCESVKAGSLWQPLVGCAERGTTFITVYAVLFCIFIAQADFPNEDTFKLSCADLVIANPYTHSSMFSFS